MAFKFLGDICRRGFDWTSYLGFQPNTAEEQELSTTLAARYHLRGGSKPEQA